MPTPITEQAADNWLYWTAVQLWCVETLASVPAQMQAVSCHLDLEVDTKAMRKLETDQAIYAIFEGDTETGTAVWQMAFDSRMLIKLP